MTDLSDQPIEGIDHIVVLMLENRSYDNILGRLYTGAEAEAKGFDPLPLDASNEIPGDPNSPYTVWTNDAPITDIPTMTIPTPDPGENFVEMNQQIYNVRFGDQTDPLFPNPPTEPPPNPPNMAGFAANYQSPHGESPGNPHDIMHYFSPKQVPVSHWLATVYGTSDEYHASAPLQTWPNRMFTHMATSGGMLNNTQFLTLLADEELPWHHLPSIYSQLDGLSDDETTIPPDRRRWKIYYQDFPVSALVKTVRDQWKIGDADSPVAHFSEFDVPWTSTGTSFFDDVKNGTLPAYSFIEPRYGLMQFFHRHNIIPPNDNHPPFNVALGELLLAEVYTALASSAAFERTLFIVTYDEHGGCYDHVPPTHVAPSPTGDPDDHPFVRYGVRIPNIFISPRVQFGTVLKPPTDDIPFDHTSIIKTVRDCFFVGDKRNQALNPRDAAAPSFGHVLNAPLDELNVANPDECPIPEVDMEAAEANFEKHGPSDMATTLAEAAKVLGIPIPDA